MVEKINSSIDLRLTTNLHEELLVKSMLMQVYYDKESHYIIPNHVLNLFQHCFRIYNKIEIFKHLISVNLRLFVAK